MRWFVIVIFFASANAMFETPQWISYRGYRGDLGDLDVQESSNNRNTSSEQNGPSPTSKLSRDDIIVNDPNNASLYISSFSDHLYSSPSSNTSYSKNGPANTTTGRALDLEALLTGVRQKHSEGHRESRIMNDNPKSNLAIQGFIPIISLASNPNEQFKNKPSKYENGDQPTSSHGYAGPEDAKFLGGALQGLASTFGVKRKQVYGHHQEDCICVPFYMCKNGYLENAVAKSNQQQYLQNDVQKQLAAAQSEINQFTIPPQLTSYYQQQQQQKNQDFQQRRLYQHQSQYNNGEHHLHQVPSQPQQQQYLPQPSASNDDSEYLPIDERTIDGSERANTYFSINDTAPQYASDVLSRMLGTSLNPGNCGVLRTCCKILPDNGYELAHQILPEASIQSTGPIGYGRPEPTYSLINPPHPQRPTYQISVSSSFVSPRPPPFNVQNHFEPINSYNRPPRPPIHHSYRPNKPFIKPGPYHQPHYPVPVRPSRPLSPVNSIHPGHLSHNQYIQRPHTPPPVSYGSCGQRKAVGIHGRVQNLQYHESSTEFGEYPWQAALLKRLGPADSLYVCGGTLISSFWVATAAHCIKKNTIHDLKVRLGEWDVHREDEFYPYLERNIAEIIIHPEYFHGNLVNDIALLRLEAPVDFSHPHIAPACLAEPFENFAGHRCWVTGWGKDSFGHQGEYQSVLKEVDLPVLPHRDCEQALRHTRLGPYYKLHHGFLCAGGEPKKDACEGDGGSPLVCEVNGIWKVAGLVSWGIGCGQPGVPGVYVNMAYYKNWIDQVISRYGPEPYSASSSGHEPYAPGIISERSNSGNETIVKQEERSSSISLENKLPHNSNETASTSESVDI